jgi:hypothetical protein
MSATRATLELQELGERTLPSPVVLHPVDPVPLTPAIVRHAHPLHGLATGTYHGTVNNPDMPVSFTLNTTAHLDGLGTFQVTGSMQGIGFVAQGRATGELVLKNAQGTITLALHGAIQSGPSFPRELVYSVTGGTGTYSHVTGYGTVAITQIPAPVAFGQPPTGVINLAFS